MTLAVKPQAKYIAITLTRMPNNILPLFIMSLCNDILQMPLNIMPLFKNTQYTSQQNDIIQNALFRMPLFRIPLL